MRTLVLVPESPTLQPQIRERFWAGLEAMFYKNMYTLDLRTDKRPADRPIRTHEDRCVALAAIRQAMVDEYLTYELHSHVLWLDADIVDFPVDLPARLLEVNPAAIVAPAVCIDGNPLRFYDTAGFVENNQRCRHDQPWFDQPGPVVPLESVGACYIVPAVVYWAGARHVYSPPFTDHMSVCRRARELDIPVLCDTRITVFHADLTRYGLAWH